jgi:hypothetical protein
MVNKKKRKADKKRRGLSERKTYTDKDIIEIMESNKIYPIHIQTVDDYNSIGEKCLTLYQSQEIVDSCWLNIYLDALYEFEHKFPNIFNMEAEKKDDEENPVYFEGKRVEFDYFQDKDDVNQGDANEETQTQ